jgi:hypothetical protein
MTSFQGAYQIVAWRCSDEVPTRSIHAGSACVVCETEPRPNGRDNLKRTHGSVNLINYK